ncbi:hypothetical protein C8R44DRAFT_748258 [Mycena epipterygia]|nr:hypothetical protein C8R44DRAFT_748258 [Mycena epipterygia]
MLSPEAQQHKHVRITLGWMAGMIKIVGNRQKVVPETVAEAINTDLNDYAIRILHLLMILCSADKCGVDLAASWPERHLAKMTEVTLTDLLKFQDIMDKFTMKWANQPAAPSINCAMQLFQGAIDEEDMGNWLQNDKDLGIEVHNWLRSKELDTYLGWVEGHPLVFHKHIEKDPTYYIEGVDKEILNCTKPFTLHHHQKSAPAAPEDSSTLVTAAPESAHKVPAAPAAPNFGEPVFGVSTGLPDCTHIIVVPNILLAQWEENIKHVFKDKPIMLVVMHAAEKNWEKDIKAAPQHQHHN